jgi:hypothetical protein
VPLLKEKRVKGKRLEKRAKLRARDQKVRGHEDEVNFVSGKKLYSLHLILDVPPLIQSIPPLQPLPTHISAPLQLQRGPSLYLKKKAKES